jgi:DNA-binding GntR family transcriptional regulator
MSLAIPAVDRRAASLRGHAYAILKQAILDGRLRPGESLVEQRLCDTLQISRSPLREALGRLEQEGLVTATPYRGTLVAPISDRDLREAFQLREALEVLSLQLAWPHLTPADLEQLTATLERARRPILSRGDAESHKQTDWAVHGLLVERSDNALLARTLQGLHERVVRWQLGDVIGHERAVDHRRDSYREHAALLEAMQARDLARAEDAVRVHVRQAGARLLAGIQLTRASHERQSAAGTRQPARGRRTSLDTRPRGG